MSCLILFFVIESLAYPFLILNDINLNSNLTRDASIKPFGGEDRRVYETQTISSSNCYINKENPSANVQPSIYIPNRILSYADMSFENIRAINYTKIIEPESTNFIECDENLPLYIYQKFSVEISCYVNNLTIFIQDNINKDLYNEENSWEVAIVNCSNDEKGTPTNFTLGVLSKPHPFNDASHWETFDFTSYGSRPVFLNVSATKRTIENEVSKYWFAFRIKIPPNDEELGGGPKQLYFNPDGPELNDEGQGETFKFFPQIAVENFTINNVSRIEPTTPINGTVIRGNVSSLIDQDEDLYAVAPLTNNVTLDFEFNVNNLSAYTYNYLKGLNSFFWWLIDPLHSIDFKITSRALNIENIYNSSLLVYNYTHNHWEDLFPKFP